MSHIKIGISVFEKDLRDAMDNRITQFVDYIRDELARDPNSHKTQSRRQWMIEFQKWSEQKLVESEILKYLNLKDTQ